MSTDLQNDSSSRTLKKESSGKARIRGAMMPVYRPVFISHAHANNAICEQYVNALSRYGVDVWIDLQNRDSSTTLPALIGRQLEMRPAFLLMVSKTSNASQWVEQELSAYNALRNDPQTRQVQGLERILLPVRLESDCAVPVIYRGLYWTDAATMGFDRAIADILSRLEIPEHSKKQSLQQPVLQPPVYPPVVSFLPPSLQAKGFTVQAYNGVGVIIPPMKTIPAGKFLMGSDKEKDSQAFHLELPQFTFSLEEYSIGKYPLTVAEYACFLAATGYQEPQESGISWKEQQSHADHPVVNVTLNDTLAYVQWLAEVTGQPYRLPTEAEWEKAARGPDGRIYPWGDQWDKTKANTSDGGPGGTTPGGSYPQGASPYGCLDMAGNVWEWTSTIYIERYPYPYSKEHEDLHSTAYGMLRGGSWNGDPWYARAAYRNGVGIGNVDYYGGGRLVRDVLAAGSL